MCFSIRLRFSETAEGTPGSETHPVYFTRLPTPSCSVSCSLIEGFIKIDIARAPAIPKKNENGDLGRELTKRDCTWQERRKLKGFLFRLATDRVNSKNFDLFRPVDEFNRGSNSQVSCPWFSTTLYAEGEKESTTGNYSKKSIFRFARQVREKYVTWGIDNKMLKWGFSSPLTWYSLSVWKRSNSKTQKNQKSPHNSNGEIILHIAVWKIPTPNIYRNGPEWINQLQVG